MAARTDLMQNKDWLDKLLGRWPHFKAFSDHINEAVLQMPLDMPPDKIMEVSKIWWKAGERILFENKAPSGAMNDAQTEAMKLF